MTAEVYQFERPGQAIGIKEVPFDLETEQGLLGILLMKNEVYPAIAEILEPEHFFEGVHQRIYEVARELLATDQAATPVTVQVYLGDVTLPGMTILQYLARLITTATQPSAAASYARIIKNLWARRRLIEICEGVKQEAYDVREGDDIGELLSIVESQTEALRPRLDGRADYQDLQAVGVRAIEEMRRLQQSGYMGVPTGFERLDAQLQIQPGDLILLGGRPGSGKTALGTNIAVNVAKMLKDKRDRGEKTGIVAFASLEMKSEQIWKRILSAASGVRFWIINRNLCDEEQWGRVIDAQQDVGQLPLLIDDKAGNTIATVRARAKRLQREHGKLELLVVDYLQLMVPPQSNRRVNEYELISEISIGLKNLAKELKCPVIALSQLNRGVDTRDDKRPMLADLRGSGSLEQDADAVMFVYREEYYLTKRRPREGSFGWEDWSNKMWACEGMAECILAKNRNGGEITVELGFDGDYMRFLNDVPERGLRPDHRPDGKAPQLRMPKEAPLALGFLRDLDLSQTVPNDELEGVPPRVRPVPYKVWRDKVVSSLLDPATPEPDIQKFMKGINLALYSPGPGHHAFIGRTADYVWLTEAGRK